MNICKGKKEVSENCNEKACSPSTGDTSPIDRRPRNGATGSNDKEDNLLETSKYHQNCQFMPRKLEIF